MQNERDWFDKPPLQYCAGSSNTACEDQLMPLMRLAPIVDCDDKLAAALALSRAALVAAGEAKAPVEVLEHLLEAIRELEDHAAA